VSNKRGIELNVWPPRKRWPIRLGPLLCAALVLWGLVFCLRRQQSVPLHMEEAASAVAAYLIRTSGEWPRSEKDLESAGVISIQKDGRCYLTQDAMDDLTDATDQFAPMRFGFELSRIEIGWDGRPVDESGSLLAARGVGGFGSAGRATILSGKLRRIANEAAARAVSPQPPE